MGAAIAEPVVENRYAKSRAFAAQVEGKPVATFDMIMGLPSLNPRLRIEQIPSAGHGVPFEQPERLAEVVGSFLRALG